MSSKTLREEKKRYILSKKQGPCEDCGGSFPDCCMDFHHEDEELKDGALRNAKQSMLVYLSRWSLERIDQELDKCVVLCANCHRIRHHR